MIAYFDTSAMIPLLIEEETSTACGSLWNSADAAATNAVAFVESAATLAMARRTHRITDDEHRVGLVALEVIWTEMLIVPVDDELIIAAAAMADSQALRSYDAVHCASAVALADVDVLAASGDRQLLRAWQDLGLSTVDVTQ